MKTSRQIGDLRDRINRTSQIFCIKANSFGTFTVFNLDKSYFADFKNLRDSVEYVTNHSDCDVTQNRCRVTCDSCKCI